MSKKLEKLRLNLISTIMEIDLKDGLMVKKFIEYQTKKPLNKAVSEESVQFSKISEINNKKYNQKSETPIIVFL